MNYKKIFVRFMGSAGFIGYLPVMPGTFGSMVGVALSWYLIDKLSVPVGIFIISCFVMALISQIFAGRSEKYFNKTDPGEYVLDEVLGQMITFVGITFSFKAFIMGFLYFRFFDIIKPGYINSVQQVPGGAGIDLDDIIAGLASCALLHLTIIFYHITMGYLLK